MDRRTTLKWIVAASMAPQLGGRITFAAESQALPYGTDPNLLKSYSPGDLWPLTLTAAERRTVKVLCDVIIPADSHSPSASAVGVVEFIDEWISAPYELQRKDRKVIIEGLAWLASESKKRYARRFDRLSNQQLHGICDVICNHATAAPKYADAARFFARFRDLCAGGFYTTPAGRTDLKYVGNVASATFEGPPAEVLKQAGLL